MRGATFIKLVYYFVMGISIHTPHAGSDENVVDYEHRTPGDFNPHSPCGERLWGLGRVMVSILISIHTPHAGSDGVRLSYDKHMDEFQSTLPMRGATIILIDGAEKLSISIHTPHAGSDSDRQSFTSISSDFNPHSPCGERLFLV